MPYFNRLSGAGRVVALAAFCMLTSAAVAHPVITGPGIVAVGSDVVFTISDTDLFDGFNPDSNFNSYLVAVSFTFDPLVLKYVGADKLLIEGFALFPMGNELLVPYQITGQFTGPAGLSSGIDVPLFTLTFTALASTGASFTIVNMSLPDDGAYGTRGSFEPTSGSAAITSAVPEPQSLTLLAIVGGLLGGILGHQVGGPA